MKLSVDRPRNTYDEVELAGPTGDGASALEHPIVLSPMAGIGTVELAASVCAAGGLGSIGCAGMQAAEARETLAALRSLASSPINVNFLCHAPARRDPALERAWRDRLTPYYREFGLDPTLAPAAIEFPSFDHDLCAVVEDARPEVVSFHFGCRSRNWSPASKLLGAA